MSTRVHVRMNLSTVPTFHLSRPALFYYTFAPSGSPFQVSIRPRVVRKKSFLLCPMIIDEIRGDQGIRLNYIRRYVVSANS